MGTPKLGTGSSKPTAKRTFCRSHLGEDVEHMATNGDQLRQPELTDRRRLFLGVGRTLLIFVRACSFLLETGRGPGGGCSSS